ncbi:MAG: LysR family transcriptional regulator [Elainellaceae cyanobacterium]
MNVCHLQVFLSVIEHGSFSEAAHNLDVSQSAVSRAIASLEEEVGVSLLLRGRFGARPTRFGERIMNHAKQILQLRNDIVYEAYLEKGLQRGRVRIASFRSAATHLLPPLIARYSQQHPDVEVLLDENDPNSVEQALRDGRADIGLMPLPRAGEDLDTWEIVQDEFVVLLPPSTRLAPKQLAWSDLECYSFILYNYAECTTVVRTHWENWHQSFRVAYEVKEDSTIVSMVSQGLGAAILPRLAAMPIPADVQVRSLPIPLMRSIGAAILADALHSPAVFRFLDLLRAMPASH